MPEDRYPRTQASRPHLLRHHAKLAKLAFTHNRKTADFIRSPRLLTSRFTTAYPSMIPLLSVNGPAITVNFPERIRTPDPFAPGLEALGAEEHADLLAPACPQLLISLGLGGSFVASVSRSVQLRESHSSKRFSTRPNDGLERTGCLDRSIKVEVKKKHISCGWNFSCFAAHLMERDLF
jgi:hypothetical protein